MNLNRLTERIWVYPYEEKRDRPNLSYIRGDNWSLAVDAGHSEDHTKECQENQSGGLPARILDPPVSGDHYSGFDGRKRMRLHLELSDPCTAEFEVAVCITVRTLAAMNRTV